MKRHILIAEDDLASAVLLTELLTRWGYEVTVAADGREALARLASRPADLVVLDLQMPVLDGFGALAQIRAQENLARVPAVALTAFAMRDDRERILAAGFDHYLTKPVRFEELKQVLEIALAGPGE